LADAVKVKENCYLINAPAGSGKTTRIKDKIYEITENRKESKVLCITLTNRAADELSKDIDSAEVQIQTIHSFFDSFMKIYFSHNEIINLYFEIYERDIINRINNKKQDERIEEANTKYKDKVGQLDLDTIKKNVTNIYYNELSFNSLYSGGLSHDELLLFTRVAMDRFPKINKRIAQKYNYIFIDEYQDSSANILKIFYQAVEGKETELYLFGDKMQQIYKSYDGSFENELKIFNQNEKLSTNYRSVKPIVNVLNNIYNDPKFVQKPDPKKNHANKKPLVYICEDVKAAVEKETKKNEDVLQLVVYNRQRFKTAGVEELFNAVNKMERYSFARKYSAVDILTTKDKDNPDDLLRLMFQWYDIYTNYQAEKYGLVIQTLKTNKLDTGILKISKHDDKVQLNLDLLDVLKHFEDNDNRTIREWLISLNNNSFINAPYYNELIESEEYKDILNSPMQEFKNLNEYLESPKVSTQHGVKGEGYDKVFFIAEDSNNPLIRMYDFYNLWVNVELVFTNIQDLYYNLAQDIESLENELGFKISKLKVAEFKENIEKIDYYIDVIYANYKDNIYFKEIYKQAYVDYKKKRGVTKARSYLKISKLSGVLNAYKLFYVGCSRAKEELVIFIDSRKVKGNIESLKEKFKEVGFEINEYESRD